MSLSYTRTGYYFGSEYDCHPVTYSTPSPSGSISSSLFSPSGCRTGFHPFALTPQYSPNRPATPRGSLDKALLSSCIRSCSGRSLREAVPGEVDGATGPPWWDCCDSQDSCPDAVATESGVKSSRSPSL
jgi:hypothetical protein